MKGDRADSEGGLVCNDPVEHFDSEGCNNPIRGVETGERRAERCMDRATGLSREAAETDRNRHPAVERKTERVWKVWRRKRSSRSGASTP